MDNQKKSSRFGLGLLIGAVVGAISTFFLSPSSGKENREKLAKKVQELKKLLEEKEVDKKVKEIFGEATEEAKTIYLKAKDWLIEELAQLKEAVEHIDKEKYLKAVEKVMVKVQKEVNKDAKQLERLKKQLIKEWNKLKPNN